MLLVFSLSPDFPRIILAPLLRNCNTRMYFEPPPVQRQNIPRRKKFSVESRTENTERIPIERGQFAGPKLDPSPVIVS